MKRKNKNKASKFMMRIVATVLVALSLFLFSACNAGEYAFVSTDNYFAYVIDEFAEDDSSSGYVRIGFTNNIEAENLLYEVDVVCKKYNSKTFWFMFSKYVYSIDSAVLRPAVMDYVNAKGSDELKNVPILQLKVFYQHATIYKSATTNGDTETQFRTYVHNWKFDLDEDVLVEIVLRNEIRASAYFIILAVAIGLLGVLVPITIVCSKKKKNKDNDDNDINEDENDTEKEIENTGEKNG